VKVPLVIHHPVEDVFCFEDKMLANFMPLLEFRWDLKENARKLTVVRVVVDTPEP